jgi:peptidyl-tRNA hydrolase, PTH1 family
MSKFLIVGLGNIGSEYANTRHNIGFDVVHAFVKKHGGNFEVGRLAYVANVKWKGKTIVCICPTTFMLTIVDDVALPLDKIRLRPGGSAGGHNGLKDIQQILSTDAYPKLRFGIGNNYPKGMQADFVLAKWLKAEEPVVLHKIEKCIDIIENFIVTGINQTMTAFNNISIS